MAENSSATVPQLPNPTQQAKATMSIAMQGVQAVQQLRSTVTNVFQLLSDGYTQVENDSTENSSSNAKTQFLQKFQELLHSVNKDFTDLEKLGNSIIIPDMLPTLGAAGQLCLDGSTDDPTIYNNLTLTYQWQTRMQIHSHFMGMYLQQSNFKRSLLSARRKHPLSTNQPNKLYKSNSQMIDNFMIQLARQFPDLSIKITNLYNSTNIMKLTVDKVFTCYVLLKGILLERVSVYGLDENYLTDENKPDLFATSRYECMRRISDNAVSAFLHYECGPFTQADVPVRFFLAWVQLYKNLFTEPCKRCGRILEDGLPPTWRARDTKAQSIAYHDSCRP